MTAALALAPLALFFGQTLSPAAARGRDALERAECHRCHDVTDVTDAAGAGRGTRRVATPRHCVRCHAQIVGSKTDETALAKLRARYPEWDRYLERVVHYVEVPDLGTLARRVDPRFIRRYLDAPFDLRPNMDETMIPVRLSAGEKDDVVAYLEALADRVVSLPETRPPPPPAEKLAEGRERYANGACPTCHVFGNTVWREGLDAAFYEKMRPAARLAPNLRYVRERIPREVLVRWITDPRSVSPTAAMHAQPLAPGDAELIADFLLWGEIEVAPGAPRAAVPEVPLLSRAVGFEEVFERVLGGACMHCHMDPSESADGGPGNTGGLGFAGVGLDLAHYAGLKKGLVRAGKRESVLAPPASGEPPLLFAALLRRHAEASRDLRPPFSEHAELGAGPGERPGMPMGLPPLPVEELALVKTWLAQGAPGPSAEWEAARRDRVARGGLMMGARGKKPSNARRRPLDN